MNSEIPTPTSTPTPTPTPVSDIIFYDDFSDEDSGWPVGSTDTCSFGYHDGHYRVIMKEYRKRCVIPAWPVPSLVSGTFSVRVRRTSFTDRAVMYGFFFGAGTDASKDRWALEVRPDRVSSCGNDGYFWLNYLKSGSGKNWDRCTDAIDTDRRKWNELKVSRRVDGGEGQERLKVYINGEAKKDLKVDPWVLPGRGYFDLEVISLYSDTSKSRPVEVEFDDFTISRRTE